MKFVMRSVRRKTGTCLRDVETKKIKPIESNAAHRPTPRQLDLQRYQTYIYLTLMQTLPTDAV